MSTSDRLRLLPAVEQVLQHPDLAPWLERLPHPVVVRFVQAETEALRHELRRGMDGVSDRAAALAAVARGAAARLDAIAQPVLRPVLNATGVILHTNLGRAPLADLAVQAIVQAARGYSDLEFDLETGVRASRMRRLGELVAALAGAPAAHVVNNNAAAVLLAVDTLGQPGVVVSRGELVEIGDGFRLPEILARARVPIHEVGTTNRTGPEDYASAATVPGCLFLKVHRSNFTVHGYTREASVSELAAAAARVGARVVYDLGAGCFEPFAADGLGGEPDVQSALRAGADLVTMSGDKLLGGPQAGILAGSAEAVAALRRNPLARALRIDKLTLAALQATLLSSVASEGAGIPTHRFILTKPEHIADRARRLVARLGHSVAADLEVAPGRASVGGGSFADVELPSYEVRIRARGMRGTELQARLRRGTPAVVARIKGEIVALDLRCIEDGELEALAQAVERALVGEST